MKIAAVIPTYNERQNIPPLVERLLALPLGLDLFFVDDGSPDQTGRLLESMQVTQPRVRVFHRPGKLGIGAANQLTRLMLGIAVRDATAGFRCYRRELLSTLDQIAIRSNGYSFQLEVTYVTRALGYRIREVPIIFRDRVHAQSKLGTSEILGAAQTLFRLGVHHAIGKAYPGRAGEFDANPWSVVNAPGQHK